MLVLPVALELLLSRPDALLRSIAKYFVSNESGKLANCITYNWHM